jgi:nucleoside-diphosphate-sugar epimerase
MKLAITGCNGSVGKRVVALALKRGHTVVGIDCRSAGESTHPQFRFVQADLKVYETALSALEGCNGVIHLAALLLLGNTDANVHNRYEVASCNYDVTLELIICFQQRRPLMERTSCLCRGIGLLSDLTTRF